MSSYPTLTKQGGSVSNFDSRRQGTGSSVSSQGSAGPTPGKRTLTEIASHPLHMAREVSPAGRLPPLKPGAALPVSMLSHLGAADPDREFDEALPMEVLAANALAHGMLGAPMELPYRAEVEAKLGRSLKTPLFQDAAGRWKNPICFWLLSRLQTLSWSRLPVPG